MGVIVEVGVEGWWGACSGVAVGVGVTGRRWGACIELGRRRRSICWVGEEVGSVG